MSRKTIGGNFLQKNEAKRPVPLGGRNKNDEIARKKLPWLYKQKPGDNGTGGNKGKLAHLPQVNIKPEQAKKMIESLHKRKKKK